MCDQKRAHITGSTDHIDTRITRAAFAFASASAGAAPALKRPHPTQKKTSSTTQITFIKRPRLTLQCNPEEEMSGEEDEVWEEDWDALQVDSEFAEQLR